MSYRRILVFGDSIPLGCWAENGGWVDKLKRVGLKKTTDSGGEERIQVINLGVGGDTSDEVLARIPSEIKAREILSGKWHTEQIVFHLGCNDASKLGGKLRVPEERFRKNLVKIIKEVAKEQGVKFIEIRNLFQRDEDLWCYDGIHPNDNGHNLIFETVKDKVL